MVRTEDCSKILNSLIPVSFAPTTNSFMVSRKANEFIWLLCGQSNNKCSLLHVLLVGLQDELVVQLDQLDAAGLLPTEDDVAVLAKGDGSGDILELKDSLHGLDSF